MNRPTDAQIDELYEGIRESLATSDDGGKLTTLQQKIVRKLVGHYYQEGYEDGGYDCYADCVEGENQ